MQRYLARQRWAQKKAAKLAPLPTLRLTNEQLDEFALRLSVDVDTAAE
jgi:hypothetical protein